MSISYKMFKRAFPTGETHASARATNRPRQSGATRIAAENGSGVRPALTPQSTTAATDINNDVVPKLDGVPEEYNPAGTYENNADGSVTRVVTNSDGTETRTDVNQPISYETRQGVPGLTPNAAGVYFVPDDKLELFERAYPNERFFPESTRQKNEEIKETEKNKPGLLDRSVAALKPTPAKLYNSIEAATGDKVRPLSEDDAKIISQYASDFLAAQGDEKKQLHVYNKAKEDQKFRDAISQIKAVYGDDGIAFGDDGSIKLSFDKTKKLIEGGDASAFYYLLRQAYGGDKYAATSATAVIGGLFAGFNEKEQAELQSMLQSKLWSGVWSNPLENLPLMVGMFLRNHELGGLADAVSNPWVFWLGSLAILFGGGMLLGNMFDSDDEPSQNKGWTTIPYT